MDISADINANDLNDDVRFHMIKNLDYRSINDLCSTNTIFRQFCMDFGGDIYKFLLRRDYGVDSPRETARNRYMQVIVNRPAVLNLLRSPQNNIVKFSDMLELECLTYPAGPINRIFTELSNYTIIFPDDPVLYSYVETIPGLYHVDDLYVRFGTELLQNHIGVYNNVTNLFTNLNGFTFRISDPPFQTINIGNVGNIRIFKVNSMIISLTQNDTYRAWFDQQIMEEINEAW